MGNCFGNEGPPCHNCRRKFGAFTREVRCGRCRMRCCKKCCSTKRLNPPQRVCPPCAVLIDRENGGTAMPSPLGTQPPQGAARHRPPPPLRTAAVPGLQGGLSCPHCKEIVDSAFIDSHIETCRQSQKRAEMSASQVTSDSDPGLTGFGRNGATRKSISKEPVECEHCKELIHPALLPTHLAHCRLRPDTGADQPVADDNEELCIICFEEKRNIAFVPCGHWTCCAGCTPRVQECPVCRSAIHTRVIVDQSVNVSVCKVCRVHIHPTFLDGHREVCRLNLKQQAKERDDREDSSLLTDPDASAADGPEEGGAPPKLCMLCNKAPREVATLPCAHYCMCHLCASTVQACPTCCRSIASTIPLYT